MDLKLGRPHGDTKGSWGPGGGGWGVGGREVENHGLGSKRGVGGRGFG